MMEADLRWFIGIAVSVSLALVGAIITAFRNLAGRISTGDRELHNRIDEVKEKYVRRDDLDGHIGRLDQNVREIREEMRENHRQVLEAIRKQ
jgi:uncharacterized protein (DUF927 family)